MLAESHRASDRTPSPSSDQASSTPPACPPLRQLPQLRLQPSVLNSSLLPSPSSDPHTPFQASSTPPPPLLTTVDPTPVVSQGSAAIEGAGAGSSQPSVPGMLLWTGLQGPHSVLACPNRAGAGMDPADAASGASSRSSSLYDSPAAPLLDAKASSASS